MRPSGCRLVGRAHHPPRSLAHNLTGSLAELLNNLDEAIAAYECALRANPRSISAMNAISCILRTQEHFHKAVDYLQNILKLDSNNGEVWGSLGELVCTNVGLR